MKKLIGLIMAAVVAAVSSGAAPVSAEGGVLNGFAVDGGVFVEYNGGKNAVINAYDGGSLVYSNSAAKEPGGYFFKVPDEYASDKLRIYCVGIGIFDIKLGEYDAVSSATTTESVTVEPTEAPTAVPAVTTTEAPIRTPIPAVYERNLDALNAPAVIEQVTTTQKDGETYHELKLLYQGVEIIHNVRDWVTIDSAPSWHSDLKGRTAEYLKEGDVIHFVCDLQHRIKSIDLIYRPDFDNYIYSGGDYGSKYSKLIGKDGHSSFAFGVPVKTAKGYVLLADVNGKTTEVDVSQDAFIYTVSASSRHGGRCELRGKGASAITKVHVANSNFDDGENVISWDEVDVNSYALARICNRTATEVIVIEY